MPDFFGTSHAGSAVWNVHCDDFGIDLTRRGAARTLEPAPLTVGLDADVLRRLEAALFDAVQAFTRDIAPTRLGGASRVRGVRIRQLYITLIADPTSSEEHRRAREIDLSIQIDLHTREGVWQDLLRPSTTKAERRIRSEQIALARLPARKVARPPQRPDMVSTRPAKPAVEAERHEDEATARRAEQGGESLHDMLRRERCCVVLGDPGSGKTMLCRWIAKELADCRHAEVNSEELGSKRAPLLILARDLIDRFADGSIDSLVSYIQTWMRPEDDAVAGKAWGRFVEQLIEDGDAFIIIDGLDEAPVKYQADLKQMIDTFARDCVARSGIEGFRPDSGLGNQILVTSRVTGYYQTALDSNIWSTFLIRPMPDSQIRQFCDNWCAAAGFPDLAGPLRDELFAPGNDTILSMARNPLLLSILCELSTRDRTVVRLPQVRAELYEQIIFETAQGWRAETAPGDDPFSFANADAILALFAPAANSIHRHSIIGEIDREELLTLLVGALAGLEGKHDSELSPAEKNRHRRFIETRLKQTFGVMSERSRGRYSFLHRTFQEYLAGLTLLLPEPSGKPIDAAPFDIPAALLAERIIDAGLLIDPHWRQPLMLLFGQLAWMEEQRNAGLARPAPALAEVIGELEARHQHHDDLLSREEWALFVADLLAEVPSSLIAVTDGTQPLVSPVVAQLLDAYAGVGGGRNAPRERRIFAERLAEIRRRIGAGPFEQIVMLAIDAADAAAGSARLGAAADLVLGRSWLNQAWVDAFEARRHRDRAAGDWPVHRLLRRAATPPSEAIAAPNSTFRPPADTDVRGMQRYRSALPVWNSLRVEWSERLAIAAPLVSRDSRAIQQALAAAPAVEQLDTPHDAVAALAALGGLGDQEAFGRRSRYLEYAGFLSLSDSGRHALLDAEPWRYIPWFGAEDTVYAMAVHLDTVGGRYQSSGPPWLEVGSIAASGAVAVAAAAAIAAGHPVRAALDDLDPDALDAGERGVLAAIRRLSAPLEDPPAAADSIGLAPADAMGRLRADFLDPCYRGALDLQKWLGEQAADADPEDWLFAHRVLASAWALAGRLGGTFEAPSAVGSPDAHSPLGEHWALAFACSEEDPRLAFAMRLDESWRPETMAEIQAMMRAVLRAHGLVRQEIALPDLLDLGAGTLPLPPIAFYEAAIALGAYVRDRLGSDLGEGWVSVALGPLVGVDPLGERYYCDYAPGEPLREGRTDWASSIDPELRTWRSMVNTIFFIGLAPEHEQLLAVWMREWTAAGDIGSRLLLARDAMALGLAGDARVLDPVRGLLETGAPGWEIEAATLAGALARERSDPAFLRLALHCLATGGSTRWRAEVMRALAPLIDVFRAEIEEGAIDRLLESLGTRDRCAVLGSPAQWLRSWVGARWPADKSLRCGLAAALIVAAADDEIAATRRATRSEASIERLWRDLTEAIDGYASVDSIGAATDALIDQAPAHGLVLTEAAARAFETAETSYDAVRAAVERLLPLIDHIPRTMLARVRGWREARGEPGTRMPNLFAAALHDHVILWLAEVDRRFAAADLEALCRLLDSGDDRSAARVKLVLSGPDTWLGDRPHRYALQALRLHGAQEIVETLAAIGCERVKTLDRSGRTIGASLLEWRNDDPELVAEWLERLSQDPGDPILRRALFRSWRWSPECLAILSAWVKSVDNVSLANEVALWLGVMHVAVEDGLPEEFLPGLPGWPTGPAPDLEWLPRPILDGLVVGALAEASADASPEEPVAALVARAHQAMRANACRLKEAQPEAAASTYEDYLSLGNGATQLLGDVPESALNFLSDDGWTERQVAALTLWARMCLDRWQARRTETEQFDLYNETLCISQLSILACLFDKWPNTIRVAMMTPPGEAGSGDPPATSWSDLLVNVIRFFPNTRIPQAAWILLGSTLGPETSAERIWEALITSVRDEPTIRERALSALASIESRTLVAAMASSPEAIDAALDRWEDVTGGQTILAMAQLFAILAREPLLNFALRRQIRARLKAIARRPSSHRPLFEMIGTGGKNENGYRIVGDGMLDEKLLQIERELAIVG
ncbi:MAG: NACHT domain-containing protein [Pseudomonadota bacterium]